MWESAKPSVAAIVGSFRPDNTPHQGREVRGSAFLVSRSDPPILLTCVHVVADEHMNVHPELSLACNFSMRPDVQHLAEARVEDLNSDLDLAIVGGGVEVQGEPVTFAARDPLVAGSPVASIGFPVQHEPMFDVHGGGSAEVELRLATGFVSSNDRFVRLGDTPYTLPHYELNMFAYPGISGAPLFDLQGRVLGRVRGTLTDDSVVAAYSYAVRTAEVLEWLDKRGVRYAVEA